MMTQKKEAVSFLKVRRNKRRSDEEKFAANPAAAGTADSNTSSTWKVADRPTSRPLNGTDMSKVLQPSTPERVQYNNATMDIGDRENQDPRANSVSVRSPMDSIAIKTPLRGNVSAKHTSSVQTSRTIASELCYNDTHVAHVLYGARGVGKTFCAYQCAQLPLAKKMFDRIVWLGLGYQRSLHFQDLVEIYLQIYAQLCPRSQRILNFDDILFVPSSSNIKTEEEKLEERRAMAEARDLLAQEIAYTKKSALICLDGMFDSSDIRYFQFEQQPSEAKCRVLSTSTDAPFDMIEKVKSWQINSMNAVDSKTFFTKNLSAASFNHPDFASVLKDCHQSCRGNPLSLRALCRLINDKIESNNFNTLKKCVTKFESAPSDPKMQLFIILEATFAHSSLGESFTKLAWRCFAAFCAVFARNTCFRPFIPRSPMRALFRAVIQRMSKVQSEDDLLSTTETADKVIDFMVKVGMLTFIDGFDCHKSPRQFFQVSCDIYQEFGQQLSANKETDMKLHELLINEYTSMFHGIVAAFGSNEIDFYMLKFLPAHSMKANELKDASLTLQDIRFIEERFKYMGLHEGCSRHIEDTEGMAELVRVTNKKMARLILATSYQNCTRVLVNHLVSKVGGSLKSEQCEAALNSMWMLAFSLFKHFLVGDGCKILQKAMELDCQEDGTQVLKLDKNLLSSLSKAPSSNSNQCSRAIILIGSAMAQSGMKRRDAIHLLDLGLIRLEESLGSGTLEVARAHVYVGEIFYRDFKMYRHALQYFRDALPIFMKELGEESEELYDAIILIGKSCIHTGDLNTALHILRNIAPKLTGSIALDVNIKVGYIYMIKGNHNRAVAILNEAKTMTSDKAIIDRIDQMIETSLLQSGRYTI